MNNVSPNVFYIGLIILAIATLVATYFKVLPVEVFTTILGALLGHAVTVVTTTQIVRSERPSPPSSPS